jgi:hypothetical protein
MNRNIVNSYLGGIKTNMKGSIKVKEKLLVIESDDWGAIRTPSKEALKKFNENGFDLSNSVYKVDALASKTDLNLLFDLLLSVKNADGQHPIITANSIMANPDFDKIRESDYKNYYYEPFYETFKKYQEHHDNLELWKNGINSNIFKPQFHGREHLNINRWMKALQSKENMVLKSFELGSTYSGNGDYSYMEAYDWTEQNEVELHEIIIKEGLGIFESTFGFKSNSFIAPCYNWDSSLEPFLSQEGITCIQGISNQLAPTGKFNCYKPINHYFGQKNTNGTIYNVRNVFFEPTSNPTIDWTDIAMARIRTAFFFNKPAVISTHRINYIGYIDSKNRDNGLLQLKKLLTKIVKKWPDIKFITSDQLINYI